MQLPLGLLLVLVGTNAAPSGTADLSDDIKAKLMKAINPKSPVGEVSYALVEKNDKFELRAYPTWNWACLDVGTSSQNSVMSGLAPLVHYMQGNNLSEEQMPLVAPAIMQRGQEVNDSAVMCLALPEEQQESLPEPRSPRIRLVAIPETRVYVRRFGGRTNSPADWIPEAETLQRQLEEAGESFVPGGFIQAAFSSPRQTKNRRNEIWILRPE